MSNGAEILDSEFIQGFSASLLDDYLNAKNYVQDVPTQSLLHIRSFTHRLTDLLAQKHHLSFCGPNLYDRIEQLNQSRVIDVKTTRALHRLRSDGNRGAHPEKYHLTQEQLLALAQKSIRDVLALIEYLYPKFIGKAAPAFSYQASDALTAKELCYRAVMEDDAKSQYLLGVSFKTKALMLKEQELALIDLQYGTEDENGEAVMAMAKQVAETFAKAAYWFSLAAPKDMDALFEHGVSLIHGYSGKADIDAGEAAIAIAARAGVVNAMALLGYFYLVGSKTIAQDLTEAQAFLERAAEGEQAEAMANLGVLYFQAHNLTQAFHYINQAAQAGYPHAQYHLALMLANGDGCKPDPIASKHWMTEAAEQGQLDAMLTLAQQILNDENAFGSDLSQAEHYLREVIKYGHSVPAMIELSMALADGILGRIDVVGSAALLNLAKRHANDDEKEIIDPLWLSLALQVDKVLEVTQDAGEIHALKRAQAILSHESH
ncbi:DUF4145 domain-containing protein [Shewanella acanthi]|uniref:DUF4145 domain-containing protein n=1 Tax=Shewanella acanthi TaxID=2864212 RepID=UPI001C65EADE|nr:DUF4145 domain-containing protein [Shewanella acanthi]QYJ78665.1 SEL1-like repeat protein [Shewanella acanthi]